MLTSLNSFIKTGCLGGTEKRKTNSWGVLGICCQVKIKVRDEIQRGQANHCERSEVTECFTCNWIIFLQQDQIQNEFPPFSGLLLLGRWGLITCLSLWCCSLLNICFVYLSVTFRCYAIIIIDPVFAVVYLCGWCKKVQMFPKDTVTITTAALRTVTTTQLNWCLPLFHLCFSMKWWIGSH